MVTLEEVTLINAPIERCFDLARDVEVHLKGNVHYGEQALAAPPSGLIGMGERVTWRARHFYIWQTLTSEITAFNPPAYFQDTMIRGIFRFMQHDHLFRSLPGGATEMTDRFRFAAPLPLLGWLAERLFLRRYMATLLHERNVVVKQTAECP
jgi:ligand-binding SRPBCC domain-containing protein